MRTQTDGFTIVELLVVITIIAILLALLTPALDRAIYQAQLAMCATNEHAGGNALFVYASDHRRYYPDRPSPWMPPFEFFDSGTSPDLRPLLHPRYMNINDVFNDPLSPKVDFAGSLKSTRVYSTYNMWFGYKYQVNGSLQNSVVTDNTGGSYTYERGMLKIGDKMEYQGDRFGVLVADFSRFDESNSNNWAGHPDRDNVMPTYRFQDEMNAGLAITTAGWGADGPRGAIDMNFLYDDGSVKRYDAVALNEHDHAANPSGRMVKLPQAADNRNSTLFVHMPVR